jgi:hypothetical protein
MARIFMDGWEHGHPTALWDAWYLQSATLSLPTVVSASGLGMTGNYCLDLGIYSASFIKVLGSNFTEIYFSFLARYTDELYTADIFSFSNGNINVGRLTSLAAHGPVRVYGDASFNFVLATGSTNITSNVTHHFCGYFKLADSGGRWVVYVDDNLEIDFTGDTKTGTSSTFNWLMLSDSKTGPLHRYYRYYDDLILDSTTMPTSKNKIFGLFPSGQGNSSQWGTSVSTFNYALIDEAPPVDADYVSASTIGLVDTYNLTDVPSLYPPVGTIKNIQVVARVKKDGTPSAQKVGVVVRTNSTDYVSSALSLKNGFSDPGSCISNMWETNPSSTGVPWNVTAVNSLQIGIKSLE